MKNNNIIYNKDYLFGLIFEEVNMEKRVSAIDCKFIKDFLDRYYLKNRSAKWCRNFNVLKNKLSKKTSALVEKIEEMNNDINVFLSLQ